MSEKHRKIEYFQSRHHAECATRKAKESRMVGTGNERYGRSSTARPGYRTCDGLAVLVEVDRCHSVNTNTPSQQMRQDFSFSVRGGLKCGPSLCILALLNLGGNKRQNRMSGSESRTLQAKSPRCTSYDIDCIQMWSLWAFSKGDDTDEAQ